MPRTSAVLSILLFIVSSSFARTTITPQNAPRIERIARYGAGEFTQAFAWSPDGLTLAVGGSIGVWKYDAANFEAAPTLWIETEYPVTRLGYSPNGALFAYTEKGTTHLIDSVTGAQSAAFERSSAFSFHPSEPLLVIGLSEFLEDNGEIFTRIALWDTERGQLLKQTALAVSQSGGGAVDLAFNADGTVLAAAYQSGDYDTCGGRLAFVYWWRTEAMLASTETDDEAYRRVALKGDYRSPTHLRSHTWVEFTPDGRLVTASGSFSPYDAVTDIDIRDIEAQTSRIISVYASQGHLERVDSLAVSPDGARFVVSIDAFPNDVVRWFELETGEMIREILYSSDSHPAAPLGFSPSGMLTIAFDRSIEIWPDAAVPIVLSADALPTPDDFPRPDILPEKVSALRTYFGVTEVISPDSAVQAVTTSQVGSFSIELFDTASGRALTSEPLYASIAGKATLFSPDNHWLIAEYSSHEGCGGNQSGLFLYSVDPPMLVADFRGGLWPAFNSDGRFVAYTQSYQSAVYDTHTQVVIAELADAPNSLLSWSPDGSTLTATRTDGVVLIYRLLK